VGESRLLEPATRVRRAGAQERLQAVAAGDRVVLEQLRDLADGRHFREAVVAHLSRPDSRGLSPLVAPTQGDCPPWGAPDADALLALRFTALDAPERPLPAHAEHAEAIAGLRARLLAARPGFPVGGDLGVGGSVLREALAHGQVLAHVDPPPAATAGERPTASRLARAQAARGAPATTLVGSVLALDPSAAALLTLLDGTRDRGALRAALTERTGLELAPGVLDAVLDRLGRAQVLIA
jgi:hypothetical protein